MPDEPDFTPQQAARLEADAARLTRVLLALIATTEHDRRQDQRQSA